MLAATVIGMGITYLIAIDEGPLEDNDTQLGYVIGLASLAALVTMIISAATITSEKESRCWATLLVTTLSPWQILLGKAVGVFRRVMPVWLLLFGHVILFTLVGYLHPILSLQLTMIVAYVVVFLTATGLYLGTRFKRTTTAVVMNLVVATVVWAILPGLIPMAAVLADPRRGKPADIVLFPAEVNPVVQLAAVAERTCGQGCARTSLRGMRYSWPTGRRDWRETTFIVWLAMALHFAAAGVLFWRAGVRIRRNIF